MSTTECPNEKRSTHEISLDEIKSRIETIERRLDSINMDRKVDLTLRYHDSISYVDLLKRVETIEHRINNLTDISSTDRLNDDVESRFQTITDKYSELETKLTQMKNAVLALISFSDSDNENYDDENIQSSYPYHHDRTMSLNFACGKYPQSECSESDSSHDIIYVPDSELHKYISHNTTTT